MWTNTLTRLNSTKGCRWKFVMIQTWHHIVSLFCLLLLLARPVVARWFGSHRSVHVQNQCSLGTPVCVWGRGRCTVFFKHNEIPEMSSLHHFLNEWKWCKTSFWFPHFIYHNNWWTESKWGINCIKVRWCRWLQIPSCFGTRLSANLAQFWQDRWVIIWSPPACICLTWQRISPTHPLISILGC